MNKERLIYIYIYIYIHKERLIHEQGKASIYKPPRFIWKPFVYIEATSCRKLSPNKVCRKRRDILKCVEMLRYHQLPLPDAHLACPDNA